MKTTFRYLHFPALLLSLFFVAACSEEDIKEDLIDDDDEAAVTAKIDGADFKSGGFLAVSTNLKIDADFNTFDLQMDAERELNEVEERIIVSLFGTDFSSLEAGVKFTGDADLNSGGYRFDGDFFRRGRGEDNGDLDIITTAAQTAASTCTITKIDHDNRLISGTFSFESIDIFGSDLSFQITEGVFTDISY